ncbi:MULTISPECIES: GlxA family transcriptional regulator [unclassified Streptomyces]|uniref:GlxA family transcriptional regulator n=1 Tax=unclassified Streptomyces TaxID=2593676 RepID=UPI0037A4EBB8
MAMTVFTHPGRHRVAVLARAVLLPIELGSVHQLFGQARDGASADGEPLYEVATCSLAPGDVRTDGDFTVAVRHGPEALAEADTVIVLSSYEDYVQDTPVLPAPLAEAFALIRPDARVASICTGAFVLASAGLLDGHTATTHWRYTELFARLFPQVALDPDVLYTDGGSVLTSAGCASGIDLCLHMIRRDHGTAVANDVARRTVVPPHREGGQVQYIRRPVPGRSSPGTAAARAWALRRLQDPITLGQLAARESMSVRHFTRRFRDEVGLTPMNWLTGQRIELARELLEESDVPVEQVAARAGLGTAANLRHHFHAALGVSPSAYRTTFRGPGDRSGEEAPVRTGRPSDRAGSTSTSAW